ncbi:arabinofuranosidase [Irpex rosettiformis]|uniref:Arabinofuranosidase n=1 Tax=Irpex rosettiformis TaxID=378272 RepID=A0ACB8UDN3_9APHY|nr:arabinofuranosidase [Irpex rosettiformis]
MHNTIMSLCTLRLVFFATLTIAQTVFATSYSNPILPGFHPDPSCIRVEEWNNTYFCATSSFNAVPGVPVFASKDLQHFKQIGNVINRESQLPGLSNTNGSTSGIWAPTIRYHDGTFWVVTTLVYDHLAADDKSRWDNILFHTKNPYDESSWSDPVHFEFEGYDTSPFWDNSGKTYIVGGHAWRVQRMIKGWEMDYSTGAIIGGIHDLWAGMGGIAPEAPHLFHRDGWYYLMIAEGGTGLGHEVNFARSKDIWGPYDPDPSNPVLTAANTTNYFQTVGHADIFNDSQGNWWTVALSTRSGPEYKYYPMGRETILTTAKWEEGQFPTFTPVRGVENGPLPRINTDVSGSGYWVGSDDHLNFAPHTSLPSHYVHNRWPDPSAYVISSKERPNTLRLTPSFYNLTGPDARTGTPQTFIGRRQEHIEFTYEVNLDFTSDTDGAEAGITVFLNQGQHFDLGIVSLTDTSAKAAGYTGTGKGGSGVTQYIRLRAITANSTNEGSVDPISRTGIVALPRDARNFVKLSVKGVNHTTYEFKYSTQGSAWITIGYGDSSQVSGGFVGTILGMFATGNGHNVSDPAYFSALSYIGNDKVF